MGNCAARLSEALTVPAKRGPRSCLQPPADITVGMETARSISNQFCLPLTLAFLRQNDNSHRQRWSGQTTWVDNNNIYHLVFSQESILTIIGASPQISAAGTKMLPRGSHLSLHWAPYIGGHLNITVVLETRAPRTIGTFLDTDARQVGDQKSVLLYYGNGATLKGAGFLGFKHRSSLCVFQVPSFKNEYN